MGHLEDDKPSKVQNEWWSLRLTSTDPTTGRRVPVQPLNRLARRIQCQFFRPRVNCIWPRWLVGLSGTVVWQTNCVNKSACGVVPPVSFGEDKCAELQNTTNIYTSSLVIHTSFQWTATPTSFTLTRIFQQIVVDVFMGFDLRWCNIQVSRAKPRPDGCMCYRHIY